MKRLSTTLALLFFTAMGLAAATLPAIAAARLKCECVNCRLEKGREQQNFTYNPNDMTSYDALEAQAMADADQKAADAAQNAAQKYLGLMCPAPCGAPAITTSHGKPFAGATRGGGIARSLWEVDYTCLKNKSPLGLPGQVNVNNGPPNPQPQPGGEGANDGPSHIEIPKIPPCFGLPVDKDDFIEELQRLRGQAMTNLPLGAEKGDPDFERAVEQSKADVAAIDAAIKEAEETPYCPPKRHSSFWDHFSVGVGVGVSGEGDHHHDEGSHGNDAPNHGGDTPHD
jgi:hypothetical protein